MKVPREVTEDLCPIGMPCILWPRIYKRQCKHADQQGSKRRLSTRCSLQELNAKRMSEGGSIYCYCACVSIVPCLSQCTNVLFCMFTVFVQVWCSMFLVSVLMVSVLQMVIHITMFSRIVFHLVVFYLLVFVQTDIFLRDVVFFPLLLFYLLIFY